MYACDIHQYLIRLNMFCTISPNITLTNIWSYTVIAYICDQIYRVYTLCLVGYVFINIFCLKNIVFSVGLFSLNICRCGVPLLA